MNLEKYRRTASGKRLPEHVRTTRCRLDIPELSKIGTDELWKIHDGAVPAKVKGNKGPSLLDVKIELAKRMLSRCMLCERQCGADRAHGEKGFCQLDAACRVFFEEILWAEEAPVVPSHEIFFSGCNMRCRFCYSWKSVIDPLKGGEVTPEDLADIISKRRQQGAINANLIGGEPTVNLPIILKALRSLDKPTAIVWNSNFFMSEETMRLLHGVVDLYLGDFRFGNEECAREVGGTQGYVGAAKRNFKAAAASGDLIIRHLLLPGHIDCCLRPIAKWVAENLPEVPFHLMFQYTPYYQALDDPALCRALAAEEEMEAEKIVSSFGLNTKRWNRPLPCRREKLSAGEGKFDTTITIHPDGRVGFMHLNGELLELVKNYQTFGGTQYGGEA